MGDRCGDVRQDGSNPVDIIGEIGDNGDMEFMIAFIKLTALFGAVAILLGWIIGTMQDRAFDREVEEKVNQILNRSD